MDLACLDVAPEEEIPLEVIVEATGPGGVGDEVALVGAAAGQETPDGALLGDEELEGLGVDGPAAALAVARVARRAVAHVRAVGVRAELLAEAPL